MSEPQVTAERVPVDVEAVLAKAWDAYERLTFPPEANHFDKVVAMAALADLRAALTALRAVPGSSHAKLIEAGWIDADGLAVRTRAARAEALRAAASNWPGNMDTRDSQRWLRARAASYADQSAEGGGDHG